MVCQSGPHAWVALLAAHHGKQHEFAINFLIRPHACVPIGQTLWAAQPCLRATCSTARRSL